MMRNPIRDLHSRKQPAPRFCDVVIEKNGQIYLEKKDDNGRVRIAWKDVLYQVRATEELAAAK